MSGYFYRSKPAGSHCWATGFYSGTARNIVIQDTVLSPDEYTTAATGLYETSSLPLIPVTLTNPDCETGNTTGWTMKQAPLE